MPRNGIKGKRLITLLSLLILLSLVLMTLNIKRDQSPFFFESLIVTILSPVQAVFTQAVASISGVFEHYYFVVDSASENKELRKEINQLYREKNELTGCPLARSSRRFREPSSSAVPTEASAPIRTNRSRFSNR